MTDDIHSRLAARYRAMATAEIARRIAEGQLIPAALEAAQAELAKRSSDSSAPNNSLVTESIAAQKAKTLSLSTLLLLTIVPLIAGPAYAYFFSPGLLPIMGFIAICSIVAIFGKRFPKLGITLGWFICLSPIVLAIRIWLDGDFNSETNSAQSFGVFLSYLSLFVYAMLAIGIGGALINGALHKGSWRDFLEQVGEKVSAQIEKARKTKAVR